MLRPQPQQSTNILDRPIAKGRGEVSQSAFAFLFSETVQYTRFNPTPAKALSTWEGRLHKIGHAVGLRTLDLVAFRTKGVDSRETDLIRYLTFIQTTVWKFLFGEKHPEPRLVKVAASSPQQSDIFLIIDTNSRVSQFISNPAEYENFSSDAFVAGIVAGLLEGAEFPAEVTAHNGEGNTAGETSYQIEFKKHVLMRNEQLSK